TRDAWRSPLPRRQRRNCEHAPAQSLVLRRTTTCALAIRGHSRGASSYWRATNWLGRLCNIRATYKIIANDYKRLRHDLRIDSPLIGGQMQEARGVKRGERNPHLEARQCQCGAWFTIKGRRDRVQCLRCEEGQASPSQ